MTAVAWLLVVVAFGIGTYDGKYLTGPWGERGGGVRLALICASLHMW